MASCPATNTGIPIIICENCEEQAATWTCPQCLGVAFCEGCWNSQLAHKARARVTDALPHEKIGSEIFDRLQRVFRQDRTPDEQHFLHVSDIDTTWFGVVKDDSEADGQGARPSLRWENRLIDIMRESQTGQFTERFPHLVSFVGQTGMVACFSSRPGACREVT